MKQSTAIHLIIFLAFCIISGFAAMLSAAQPPLPEVLTLEFAKQTAQKLHPDLETVRQRVFQAQEAVRQAKSAWLPSLDASATATRLWLSNTDSRSMGYPDEPVDYFTGSLTAGYLLFNGFERTYALSSARFKEAETTYSLADAQRLLLYQVARAWYAAVLARENMTIAEASRDFNLRLQKEAEKRLEMGTGSLSDVLNFKVRANAARSGYISARGDFEAALAGLAEVMGLSRPDLGDEVTLPDLRPETGDEIRVPAPDALIRMAMDLRPDKLARKQAVLGAESGVNRRKSAFYPTIRASASFTGERYDDMGFEDGDVGTTLAVTLSYNLYAGGAHLSAVREAKANLKAEKSNLTSLDLSIKSEIYDALAQLEAAADDLGLQKENARLVKENRDLVEKEYAAGQAALVRLNEAQLDLIEAESRLALSRVSLRLAWESVAAAVGENQVMENLTGRLWP